MELVDAAAVGNISCQCHAACTACQLVPSVASTSSQDSQLCCNLLAAGIGRQDTHMLSNITVSKAHTSIHSRLNDPVRRCGFNLPTTTCDSRSQWQWMKSNFLYKQTCWKHLQNVHLAPIWICTSLRKPHVTSIQTWQRQGSNQASTLCPCAQERASLTHKSSDFSTFTKATEGRPPDRKTWSPGIAFTAGEAAT